MEITAEMRAKLQEYVDKAVRAFTPHPATLGFSREAPRPATKGGEVRDRIFWLKKDDTFSFVREKLYADPMNLRAWRGFKFYITPTPMTVEEAWDHSFDSEDGQWGECEYMGLGANETWGIMQTLVPALAGMEGNILEYVLRTGRWWHSTEPHATIILAVGWERYEALIKELVKSSDASFDAKRFGF